MKKTLVMLALLVVLSFSALAAKNIKPDYKLDCNGTMVLVEESVKRGQGRTFNEQYLSLGLTGSYSFFSENYLTYLGQEVFVGGVKTVDTFSLNDVPGACVRV